MTASLTSEPPRADWAVSVETAIISRVITLQKTEYPQFISEALRIRTLQNLILLKWNKPTWQTPGHYYSTAQSTFSHCVIAVHRSVAWRGSAVGQMLSHFNTPRTCKLNWCRSIREFSKVSDVQWGRFDGGKFLTHYQDHTLWEADNVAPEIICQNI